MEVAIIAVVVVVLAIILLRRSSSGKTGGKRARAKKKISRARAGGEAAGPYRGVSLEFDPTNPDICERAKAIGTRRFLVGEAPTLPLQGCASPRCACKYAHHKDRRDVEDDRRHPSSLQAELYGRKDGGERRKKRGRRKEDWS